MGLTVNLPQTKLLVSGKCNEDDMQLIVIRRAPIEVISEFKYLGSVVEAQGETLKDVENRITRASSAFGALCRLSFPGQQSIHQNQENGIPCCGLGSAAIRSRDMGDQESCNKEFSRLTMGVLDVF